MCIFTSFHDSEQNFRYARAFMLELFSTVMFSDHSGYIQTMYIQFLGDLDNPPRYAWGAAVLAHLYRGLCWASDMNASEITGPLALLQIWLWTRFPIGRPEPNIPPQGLNSQPFGIIWMGRRRYRDDPHRSISLYRYIL